MENSDFTLTLTAKASASAVMKRISQVNLWWAKKFEGQAGELGDEFSVRFGDTFVDFKITEIIPNRKVIWRVSDCNLHWINHKKEWNGTEIIWSLIETGGVTQIHFVHKGLTPKSECYGSCRPGWTHHIKDSLLPLIESGKGLPE